jgi:glycosyltransferase involved in cell wall biosynthesis
MVKLSAVMIVKNESANLRRCVESLSCVDEIIVLDTGSTDDTLQLANELGCRPAKLAVWEGFGKAKQAAVDLATNDWVLSIDADEVLTPELQREIGELARLDFKGFAWRIKRRTWYLGKLIRFCGWQHDKPVRIFDRRKGSFSSKAVHEGVRPGTGIRDCRGIMYHYSYPNLPSHVAKMRFYGELGAREMWDKGRHGDPGTAVLRAVGKFIRMYFLQLGFLDGWQGLQLCAYSAWGLWYKYHLLWKLGR